MEVAGLLPSVNNNYRFPETRWPNRIRLTLREEPLVLVTVPQTGTWLIASLLGAMYPFLVMRLKAFIDDKKQMDARR